ncbi:hypothetical protein SD77_0200 [Bacillus badius]|uniref:Mobile element protein n=1 Tax=Bacillus badius TaxID=1455 RepID=A0ABR5B085_BACBA|nr:hypothetical protein SD77_0200 [Bacillus badius]
MLPYKKCFEQEGKFFVQSIKQTFIQAIGQHILHCRRVRF